MNFDRDVAGLIDDLKKAEDVISRIDEVKVIKGEVSGGFGAMDYVNYIPMIRDISCGYRRMIRTIFENTKV